MARVEASTTNNFTATERLWLTADKERVVSDGDPEAATLFATPGDEVSGEDVERYGLKQQRATADKQAPAPANKSRGG